MDKKTPKMEDLINFFLEAKRNGRDVGIKLKMPNQTKPEIILNYNSSIDTKLEYYKKTYDDNLIHKNNSEIQIIDLYTMNIPF